MQHIPVTFAGALGPRTVDLMIASTMFERMRGLLAREALGEQQGMLLQACRLIHTCGMRYPIDVVYLSRDGVVLKVTRALVPRRADGHWRAHSVLEMAAGEAGRCGIQAGTVMPFRRGKIQLEAANG